MPEPTLLVARGTVVPVKVCGLTRLADAQVAWDLGAAALGFIFHPGSPRCIQSDLAREIRRLLPPEVRTVGVFVDRPADEVNRVADQVGLDLVQLHGQESADTVAACERPVIKAVREGEPIPASAAALLLDGLHPHLRGGTGLLADWEHAARLAQRWPVVLAGGLGAGNVRQALAAVKPHALDVNSGVEKAPGIKDPNRLRELFLRLKLGVEG